ncbi:MAG: hypothetical protein M1833_001774 [Piccolia ochrophora]|nr:MAG: hypothetical protein M1833_001774 [Piccolia ochrophora]
MGPKRDAPKRDSELARRREGASGQDFNRLSAICFLISTVFLGLVLVGNTRGLPLLDSIYFVRLDLTDVLPQTISKNRLVNFVARTAGLHDYYQVGLWNYCGGYNDKGITSCSSPANLYWDNPVEKLLSKIVAGVSFALPARVADTLQIVYQASRVMFGLFLLGAVLSVFSTVATLFPSSSSLPRGSIAFVAALTTTAASTIATAMFVMFQTVFSKSGQVNVSATLGIAMYSFMWIASVFGVLGWLVQSSIWTHVPKQHKEVTKDRKTSKSTASNTPKVPQTPKTPRSQGKSNNPTQRRRGLRSDTK